MLDEGNHDMRTISMWGGLLASTVLIAFAIASITLGVTARSDVRTALAAEGIVGTPDSSIPNQKVDTGAEAEAFAKTIRKHTLAMTDGQTYAEMGRFLDADGNDTSDESKAATDPETGEPVENGARNVWVTSTALSTALNVSFFAERVALFSIMMGVALLLTGIGFFVLCLGQLRSAPTVLVAPAVAEHAVTARA
jgi:hypothetical protein